MATIKDIAREAGVSFTTVSNVIHGNTKRVSPATVEKIQKIMKELHYVPNMGARMLAGNQSRIIGVVARDLTEPGREGIQSPFMAEILGAMEKEIRKHNYYMMLCFSNSVEEMEHLLNTWNVDGVVTVSLGTAVSKRLGEVIKVPAVFTDCYFQEKENYYNVGTMDEEGAFAITSYLIQQGHEKLLFLSDVDRKQNPADLENVGRMRELGFLRALKAAGIPHGEEGILFCSNQKKEKEVLFQQVAKRKGEVTALVFCNDYFAMEGMDYFRHHNIRIPEDFSITGFDDIDMARLSVPRLTTVHQGVSEKGRLAIQKLIHLIEKQPQPLEKDSRIPVELVIRESVKKLS